MYETTHLQNYLKPNQHHTQGHTRTTHVGNIQQTNMRMRLI